MKKIMKIAFVATFAAVAGYGVYTSQKVDTMTDLMLANVEALAGGESVDRDDSMVAPDLCSMVVIYPDGDYGEDILLGHTKRPGWI